MQISTIFSEFYSKIHKNYLINCRYEHFSLPPDPLPTPYLTTYPTYSSPPRTPETVTARTPCLTFAAVGGGEGEFTPLLPRPPMPPGPLDLTHTTSLPMYDYVLYLGRKSK